MKNMVENNESDGGGDGGDCGVTNGGGVMCKSGMLKI